MNSRRMFLDTSMTAAGGLLSSIRPVQSAVGPPVSDLKITDLRTYRLATGSLFVKVFCNNGESGIGECSPMNTRVLQSVIEHALKPIVMGKDPFDVEPLYDQMLFHPFKLGPHGALSEAIAGIDLALWDLKGKMPKRPVYRLLGGAYRRSVPVYFSLGWNQKDSPEEVANTMKRAVGLGYRAVKMRMNWSPLQLDDPNDPAEAYLAAIRSKIGNNIKLMFDVNNGYSTHRAIQMGRRFQEKFQIVHYEEPTPQYDYEAMAEVADALDVPVAAGEHEYTRWQFKDLIRQGKPDIIQPDVTKCGGLTEAKKISALAQAHNKPIVVHNTQPTLGTAASLHFVASCSNAGYPQEFTGERPELLRLFRNKLIFEQGTLRVPEDPGLGLEADMAALEAAAENG
ncbi:MAG TPA: mandelate racemase/muconate lactonizing enzyme family protein [Terriglobia bacterium]|nr:mandelate racemase/muconate lactonizing enzyme family protein [Terriglobia bacterium]